MANTGTQQVKVLELTGPEAAGFIGVSYRQFANYLEGTYPPPRLDNKKFRSDQLGKWLRDKVTREIQIVVSNDPNKINAAHERARKDMEQADKIALENRVRRAELVEAKEVEASWSMILMRVRTRLLAIPTALAPVVAIEDDKATCQEILQERVDEALAELSSGFDAGESDEE